MFHFPLAWEHNDPELYDLHFWLVSCYLIQHSSIYTLEAYEHLVDLFKNAYDKQWPTSYILQQNRAKLKEISVVMNTVERDKRQFKLKEWSFTIADVYKGGEERAIENIKKWRDCVRKEL